MIKSLSVFFPVYNEEQNISTTVFKALTVLSSLPLKWEILIIDGASSDNSLDIAKKLARKNKSVSVVALSQNGYGRGLNAGFNKARYDWIVYTDSDGQFDLAEINNFLKFTSTADALWGYRIERKDQFYRKIFTFGWKVCLFLLFGLRLKDVDCGFKMIKRKVIKDIGPLVSTKGAMVNAELALKIRQKGFTIKEIGVHHYPRRFGRPTGSSLGVILNSYRDLLQLRLRL